MPDVAVEAAQDAARALGLDRGRSFGACPAAHATRCAASSELALSFPSVAGIGAGPGRKCMPGGAVRRITAGIVSQFWMSFGRVRVSEVRVA